MSKLSKRLETRRQQARIAAAQAAIDEAADPGRNVVPTPTPTPSTPHDTSHLHAPIVGAPERPTPTATLPPEPVATTLPRVAAIDEPEPEPKRRSSRRRTPPTPTHSPGIDGEVVSGGRGALAVVAIATIAFVIAADVAIGRGTPALADSWDLWAIASAAAAAALVYGAARLVLDRKQWAPTRRQLGTAAGIGILAVAAFTLGVTQSVVVDGKVMSATSDAARSYEMSAQMLDDLDRLAVIDDLVATDAAQAQARFSEFDGAQADAQEIADRWATIDSNGVPAGELVPAVENLKSAGFAAAKAVEARKALVGTNDARLAADIASMRTTYIDAALGVGPAIADVEERFGFTVTDSGADELE